MHVYSVKKKKGFMSWHVVRRPLSALAASSAAAASAAAAASVKPLACYHSNSNRYCPIFTKLGQ